MPGTQKKADSQAEKKEFPKITSSIFKDQNKGTRPVL